ncbi:hypothetical protein OOZ54_12715 [Rhodopseudomonas palustris]|uniref:hypothetical protein n=1 Tax=Rhodopseudomonas palustris TaxID=1076 RepID=UPI0022F09A3E|nr:hypothetical protein [Rhodopseudomonas palustris]WBU27557.1 hypothetical protein OOZ54_12715 [Rhodopseudomonas palustris]
MNWDAEFDDPIPLPTGGALTTLRQAAAYIEALPTAEQQHPKVQAAIHVLLQAADHGGPIVFARIGVLRMLSRHTPPPAPRVSKRRRR